MSNCMGYNPMPGWVSCVFPFPALHHHLAIITTSRPPLTTFLKWFRTFYDILLTGKMMDCSDTKALAVEMDYSEFMPNIISRACHRKKNWWKQLRDKVGTISKAKQKIDAHLPQNPKSRKLRIIGPDQRSFPSKLGVRSVVDKLMVGLPTLLYTTSKDIFNILWRQWVVNWVGGYKHVVDYFKQWWIKRLAR
jgi:hypothetical protein